MNQSPIHAFDLAPRVQIFVDFDGTIAPDEPTDAMLERFAAPGWRELETKIDTGELTAAECAALQIGSIEANETEIDQYLANTAIDPEFPAFVGYARAQRAGVLVVSDGFDRVIKSALRAANLNLPYVANSMVYDADGGWRAEFPYQRANCGMGLGNCKCSHLSGERALKVMVGDGRSDFCIAEACDLVLAKGKLAERCRANDIPCIEISDFGDALTALAGWLQSRALASPNAAKAA